MGMCSFLRRSKPNVNVANKSKLSKEPCLWFRILWYTLVNSKIDRESSHRSEFIPHLASQHLA